MSTLKRVDRVNELQEFKACELQLGDANRKDMLFGKVLVGGGRNWLEKQPAIRDKVHHPRNKATLS